MLYQAPSPQQKKKEPQPRENKLRLFLKRSSEPLLNLQNAAHQVSTTLYLYQLISTLLMTMQMNAIAKSNFHNDVYTV